MNREEQEKLRHEVFIKELDSASKIDELPKKIAPSSILRTLVSAASFNGKKIEEEKIVPLVNSLIDDSTYYIDSDFKEKLTNIIKEAYGEKSVEEIDKKVSEVLSNKRLFNLVSEANSYKRKYAELYFEEKKEEHNKRMSTINSSMEIERMPKIGLGDINSQIKKDLYEYFNKEKLKAEYTGPIVKAFINAEDYSIYKSIKKLCLDKPMIDSYNDMNIVDKISYIKNILSSDYELNYLIEEYKAREARILKIYKFDHEDIMEQIKQANRISEMPTGLSISRITSYLSGNSLIYPKGKTIVGGQFTDIAKLLLDGKKMEDEEVQEELKVIAKNNYEEKPEEAYSLLKNKLSNLPRLYYYVEEVKYGLERQQEFIKRGASNVNVFFIPNPKSPIDGGKFYNIYVNRDTNKVLTPEQAERINEIISSNDGNIDALETYLKENFDSSTKLVGGAIVNKDESIGKVTVFKPNDGKVSITPEEKTKYDRIEELSKKLKEVTDIRKKAQEDYLKQQALIDEQISTIQDAINVLVYEKGKDLK